MRIPECVIVIVAFFWQAFCNIHRNTQTDIQVSIYFNGFVERIVYSLAKNKLVCQVARLA